MSLAQMLSERFEITFVSLEIPESIVVELEKLRFNLLMIEAEDAFIDGLNADVIVVLDHYGFDSGYQKKIKEKGAKLVFIDDLHSTTSFADLIINHTPGVKSSSYNAQNYTQFALGPDYALLRPIFLHAAKEPRKVILDGSVFICFGGSDNRNITQRIINVLKSDKRFKKIIVVVGALYECYDDLKLSILDDKRFFLYRAIDSNEMHTLMVESELAIVPASGILQEVLAVGCSVISGMYIENQKTLFENYKTLGVFHNAADFSLKHIMLAINSFFDSRKDGIERKIDGKSGHRLLNIFNRLITDPGFSLRVADEADLDKTFEWAANEEIRKYSFSKDIIKFPAHSNWFFDKIKDESCYYFIASIDNERIGSVRFDVKDNDAIVSYLLDPAFQNRGLGIVLLKEGLKNLLDKDMSEIKNILGFVMPENIPSVKAFERLGFEKVVEAGNFKFIKRIGNENRPS
jgi:UDP-2,4-diacetamido-2,4,6-trideoxy-beta-L-altropyranose hydrolase